MRYENQLEPVFAGRKVLVTGGLGFIGSSVARSLVALGAKTTLIDAAFPEYGANRRNIEGISDRVAITIGDLRDPTVVRDVVRGQHFIVNLAGVVSHIDSMRDPWNDVALNCEAQATFLSAVMNLCPEARIVFAGTRAQYGKTRTIPVNESHPIRPADINGVNNATAEAYHLMLSDSLGVKSVSLRLSNTYGPRQGMRSPVHGIINWFIRLAMDGEEIPVFGDGTQLRDATFIDDVVDALLLALVTDACFGEVFNIGAFPSTLMEIVQTVISVAGSGSFKVAPFPDDLRRIEIGDYRADCSKFSAATGWGPAVDLESGVARTIDYYRSRQADYW